MSETAVRVLDVAARLAQTRGFNGFSYADVALKLGITKASLHYHFASKAQLGSALIVRYTHGFCAALAQIDGPDSQHTLRQYVQLYEDVLVRDEMCLCGMFAAEYSTLPAQMQQELMRFFDANDTWLAAVLQRGRTLGGLQFDGAALEAARTLTAGLEGAMLLSRSYREPARFATISSRLLSGLGVAPPAVRSVRLQKKPRASRRVAVN
jgi:TetR/AcrR family transcriptional regulator, transcriptional repressor for nem operon